uniref:Uncharacterized protein n=1 Tax=Solanum lycopersicum TaxID=4081 RepID=A0A3Q7EUZ1_SOLLC
MAFHHSNWIIHMVEQRRLLNALISVVHHTQRNNVGCGMRSSPLDSTNGRTTSDDVRTSHAHVFLGNLTRSNDVKRGMPSWPLDRTHGWTTLGVACHHCPCIADKHGQHMALHAIIDLGQHTRSDKIVCEMPSLSFQKTHYQTTSSVAFHHIPGTSHKIGRLWSLQVIITLGQ